jgi:hypothetical protein
MVPHSFRSCCFTPPQSAAVNGRVDHRSPRIRRPGISTPTEFHFFTRGLRALAGRAVSPSALPGGAARARKLSKRWRQLDEHIFVLTSIAWRGHGSTAIGRIAHACTIWGTREARSLAARAMGCHSVATGRFPDEVAQSCR